MSDANRRAENFTVIECEHIPNDMQPERLYVSRKFNLAIHLCACGCGGETVTPLLPKTDGWELSGTNGLPTLSPSIGNWSGETPYHAHYFIRDGKVVWA